MLNKSLAAGPALSGKPADAPFTVAQSFTAGRYVVAKMALPAGMTILTTGPPILNVILREYRKEASAYCFHYDRGRNLAVRQDETGKAFCSEICRSTWAKGLDQTEVESWKAVERHVKKSTRKGADNDIEMVDADAERPTIQEIEAAFLSIRPLAAAIRADRDADIGRAPRRKANSKARRKAEAQKGIDPDVLSLLLVGVHLRAKRDSHGGWDALRYLARTQRPYTSTQALQAHCDAFLQLLAILPQPLLEYVTEETIRDTIAHEVHNSFGIRSLDDAGDEFLGYGVWPEASLFNHSCSPNVGKARGGRRGGSDARDGRSWTFWTTREVKEGEELSISYLGGEEEALDVRERRRRLKAIWEFDCECNRCLTENQQVCSLDR